MPAPNATAAAPQIAAGAPRIARGLVLALIVLTSGALGGVPAAADDALIFGVLNQQSPALTAERWNPILHYLATVSGVPLVALRNARVNVNEVFAGNQEGAMAQLKARRVDAAAVNSRFLAQYAEREGVTFREIYVSEGFPELAVIVHPRVDAATVDKLRRALIGMADSPAAAPILARVKFKGFAPASDRDYDGVRRIYKQIGQ